MFTFYTRKVAKLRGALLVVTVCAILAAIPFIVARHEREQTSRTVEFVFDYRDLLEIASYRGKPREVIAHYEQRLRQAGITTMAVYESTLRELEWAQYIRVYAKRDVAMVQGQRAGASDNETIVVFLNDVAKQTLMPLIMTAFPRVGVDVQRVSLLGEDVVQIAMPPEVAKRHALDPNPLDIQRLQSLGFHIAVRLTDQRQPFDTPAMKKLLTSLAAAQVTRIIFDGSAVSGFADDPKEKSLQTMGRLMQETNIGLSMVEIAKPQQGIRNLAQHTSYNVVRLHSIPASLISEPDDVIDRINLAVQDRNIRMIYWNAHVLLDPAMGIYKDNMEALVHLLSLPAGPAQQLKKNEFTLGVAQPFASGMTFSNPLRLGLIKAVVATGAVAWIAWMVGQFVATWAVGAFLLGLVGSGLLWLVAPQLVAPALALGASIATVTNAMCYFIRRVAIFYADKARQTISFAVQALVVTSGISLIGATLSVGLLDSPLYLYGIDLFRGVTALHVIPIVLVFVYFVYVQAQFQWKTVVVQAYAFLQKPVTVVALCGVGVAVLLGMYYLSRTGNAGQTTELERIGRQLLQDVLGVRPRTKEFLLAHPMMIVALLCGATWRKGWLGVGILFITIGQISIVDTFAHLHTPLAVSVIRVSYGIVLGALIGGVLSVLVKGVNKRWSQRITP